MTKVQLKKLESIIGKLESLQHEVTDNTIKDCLSDAKSALILAYKRR